MEDRLRALLLGILNSELVDNDLQVIAYNMLNQGYRPTDREWAAVMAVRLLGGPERYTDALRTAAEKNAAVQGREAGGGPK